MPEKLAAKAPPDSLTAHAVWKCESKIKGRRMMTELALFPDQYFIARELDSVKKLDRLIAGNYKIALDGRKFSRTPIAVKETNAWQPILQSPSTDASLRATRDYELNYSDSSSILKPQDTQGVRDDEQEVCTKENQLLQKYEALRKEIPSALIPAAPYTLGAGPESSDAKGLAPAKY